jgi:outer membrane autotransporter protein
MSRLKLLLPVLLPSFLMNCLAPIPEARAEVIGFDDIITDISTSYVPDGYNGFNWSSAAEVVCLHQDVNPGTGYDVGTISPNYVSFNAYGYSPTNIDWAGTGFFNYTGAFWTSAWNDQTLQFYGFNNGELLYTSSIYNINTTTPLWIELNWGLIDRLQIVSSSWQWAMDNFTFNDPVNLYMNSPSYSWQDSIWQWSPVSSTFLWADGGDANFIGSGLIYSVFLDSPVIVRDMTLTGGQLFLTSPDNGITFTDSRDGYSGIDVALGSSLTFDTPVTATGGLLRTGSGNVTFNEPLSVHDSFMLLSGNTFINNNASIGGDTFADGNLKVNGSMSTNTLNISESGTVRVNGRVDAGETDNLGFLNVNGTLNSPVTNYGHLGGSGRINGSVYNSNVISPGNSIATLTVNGSYTHGPGATFIAEIDKKGRSDLLYVTGKANIQGGTVATHLPRALYTDGSSWKFLQASGGINGQFTSLTGQPDSSTLSLSLDYTSNAASITLNRKSYATFSSEKGAQAIGYALDSYVPLAVNKGDAMENLLIALDFGSSPAAISNTLSELNPELYPTFLAIEQQAALRFSNSMSQRSSMVRELSQFNMEKTLEKAEVILPQANGGEIKAVANTPDWLIWGKAQGESVSKDTSTEYNGYDFKTGGAVMGADTRVSDSLRFGMAAAFETTDIDWKRSADGSQDNIMVGVYAGGLFDGYYADAQGSAGFHDNNASRTVFNSRTNADFNGQSYMAHLGGGYDFHYENCMLGPLASLSYVHVRTSNFSESGTNSFSLTVDDSSENVFLSSLGFHAASKFTFGPSTLATKLKLAWQHDFHGEDFTMDGNFDDYPSFTFSGPGLDQDMLIATTEAAVFLGEQLNVYAELGGGIGSDSTEYNVSVGLQWLF